MAVELAVDASATATFHGRDVFAPAAARLARGEPLDTLGTRIDSLEALPDYRARREGDAWVGRVLHVDRFGNAITSIRGSDLPDATCEVRVECGALRIEGLRRTYADAEPGEPIALLGSSNHLEIAVRGGRAADRPGLGTGSEVVVRPR